MFTRRFAPVIGSVAFAVVLGFGSPAVAQRQGGNPGARPGGGMFFGGGGLMGANADPTMSNLMGLLQRPDVQRTLVLTVRQRDALQELQTKSANDMRQKMMENLRDMRSLSPEERRAQQGDLMAKMRAVMTTAMGDLDKQTEAILKPEQVARLHELDLQFRGPLAIGDPKLQDKLELTPEQRQKVDETAKEFRAAQMKAVQEVFQGFTRNRPAPGNADAGANNAPGTTPPANGAPAPPARPDPSAIQAQMQLAEKEVDKQKKISGDKVLTVLTDAQRQNWQTLQGKPFVFRKLMDTQ